MDVSIEVLKRATFGLYEGHRSPFPGALDPNLLAPQVQFGWLATRLVLLALTDLAEGSELEGSGVICLWMDTTANSKDH
ncbi:MAG TPA: hypothetical protein VGS59_02505 [Candidatus Acidoferrales bacterium]|nr:hypothetical protein [Candidatus Acidoferrales bacterium]